MKGFLKGVVWILVLAAVCVGVYYILPEYPQSYVKSVFQPMVDAVAKAKIEQVQGSLNKDLDNASYKTILESKTKNPCWVYIMDDGGVEHVVFYGRGVSMNLKEWGDYQGKLSTSASIKIDFEFTTNGVSVHPYVDGYLMEINDGKHVDQNKKIRKEILSQLYSGMGALEQQ